MESAGMRLPARSSIPLDNNTLQNSQASLPPIDEIRNGLFWQREATDICWASAVDRVKVVRTKNRRENCKRDKWLINVQSVRG